MSPKHSDADSPLYHIISRDDPPMVWVVAELLGAGRFDSPYFLPEFMTMQEAMEGCNYRLVSIGEVTETISDGLHGIRHYVPEGIPLLGVGNIVEHGLDLAEVNLISLEEHHRLSKSQVQAGDVLLTITGRLGTATVVPGWLGGANLSAHVARLVPSSHVNGYYLAAFLNSAHCHFQIQRKLIGTTHPHINVNKVAGIQIPLPPRPIQDYIGNKVKRAEELRAEADHLQQEAEALLDEALGISAFLRELEEETGEGWYWVEPDEVDQRWDPAANHPERTAIIRKMRDSAKCPVVGLREVVKSVTSSRRKQKRVTSDAGFFLSILHVDAQGNLDLEAAENYVPASPGIVCQEGDLLYSRINPRITRVTVIPALDGSILCSGEFEVVRARSGFDAYFLSMVLRSPYVARQVIHLGQGTSSSRRRVKRDDLWLLNVPVPDSSLQRSIGRRARTAIESRQQAKRLLAEAKDDVERLVRGELDLESISVAG